LGEVDTFLESLTTRRTSPAISKQCTHEHQLRRFSIISARRLSGQETFLHFSNSLPSGWCLHNNPANAASCLSASPPQKAHQPYRGLFSIWTERSVSLDPRKRNSNAPEDETRTQNKIKSSPPQPIIQQTNNLSPNNSVPPQQASPKTTCSAKCAPPSP
jgi:hypothetical protein